jgi:hypothetical protein
MDDGKKAVKKKPEKKTEEKEEQKKPQAEVTAQPKKGYKKYTVRLTPALDEEFNKLYEAIGGKSMRKADFLRELIRMGIDSLKAQMAPQPATVEATPPSDIELAARDEEGWFDVQGKKIKLVPA